jgi:hypothetical protein
MDMATGGSMGMSFIALVVIVNVVVIAALVVFWNRK